MKPDEPTCIYNPAFHPGSNQGWKIVLVRDVPEWLDRGWVATLRESLDKREGVRAEIVQEMVQEAVDKEDGFSEPKPEPTPPISENVRNMAEAHSIPWAVVKGTGQNGRILKADIQRIIDGNG